jgi:hypothetical protein
MVLLLDEAREHQFRAGTRCRAALFPWTPYGSDCRTASYFRAICEMQLVTGPALGIREASSEPELDESADPMFSKVFGTFHGTTPHYQMKALVEAAFQ